MVRRGSEGAPQRGGESTPQAAMTTSAKRRQATGRQKRSPGNPFCEGVPVPGSGKNGMDMGAVEVRP